MSGTRVYVGNLPMDIRTREVEDIFYKYGRIRDIDVKFPSRPPAFAFVDFEDPRDAEDAIRGRDGYDYDGARLRVEPANGGRRDAARGSTRYPRNIRGTGDYTVEISNLPPRVSWQDLKDFMRKAGDVVFTEVDGRGGGIVEYSNKRDMKYAVEKLDDSEFRGRSENSSARRSRKRSRSRSEGDRDADADKKARRSASPDKEPETEKDADDKKAPDDKPQDADAADQKDEPKAEQQPADAQTEKTEDEPKMDVKADAPEKDDQADAPEKDEQTDAPKAAEATKEEAPKEAEASKEEAPAEEAPKDE
ncbi:unnamed protein product [Phytophthora fragariaefolia]|uniref:Unnamed protein product n=1 Tax=Phytophthora fragariaefolia TaxID=1490495 RepID=A0A9W7CXH5_9STRA|nr:unnamed protein product [Phytophthora fragariaefolia]